MPRTISIVAPGNGSGKTTLAETILRAFPGEFTVIKVSTVYRDGRNCPKTENACACQGLHGQFTVITDPLVIEEEGTDTGRLVRAGAARTLWCLSRPGAHGDLWRELRSDLIKEEETLLTEGNRIVAAASPSVLLVVASPRLPRERWKEDAWDLMERADLVVVNDETPNGPVPSAEGRGRPEPARGDTPGAGSTHDATGRLAAEIEERIKRRVIVQDVSAPLSGWSDSRVELLAMDLIRRRSPDAPTGAVTATSSGE